VVEASTPQSPVVRRPMIRWLPLAALALFILLPPPALTTVPDRASPASARVAGLEHELMSAIQARDGQRLDDLIAADCELTGTELDVERVDKHAYVTAALDPNRLTIEDFRFVDLRTTMVANDVAIVRARLDRRGWLRGRLIADRLLLTDVWKQRDVRWQLVSRHASPTASGVRGVEHKD
jgi:hypothetical protein